MLRQMIKIDEELCNGCGICIDACHEGALQLVNGKAKLIRDDYCDGLGNCLPACPTGAISFEMREAAAFDAAAVAERMQGKEGKMEGEQQSEREPGGARAAAAQTNAAERPKFGGCPGSMARAIRRDAAPAAPVAAGAASASAASAWGGWAGQEESALQQWPVQIKLVPVNAPYFNGAKLLVAADCSAFAYANFHRDFIKDHICIIGCPKLDEGDYADKLSEILRHNDIKSVSVVRMEVPCCGGIENAVKNALSRCGKLIPWNVSTISTDGRLLERF